MWKFQGLGAEATSGAKPTLELPSQHPSNQTIGLPSPANAIAPTKAYEMQSASPQKKRRRYKDFEAELMAKLESVKALLATAEAENQQLKDLETALVSFDGQAAYLSSVLSRAELSCCFLPSTRLGTPPVCATINYINELAWAGKQPLDEWLHAYSQVPPDFLFKSDEEFFRRLQSTVITWSHPQTDSTVRCHLEGVMTTTIRFRHKVLNLMAEKFPLFLRDNWRTTMPPPPSTREGKRLLDELVRLVAGMYLTGQQKESIRAALSNYRSSMRMIEGQIVTAQRALAGLQSSGGENEDGHTAALNESIGASAIEGESIEVEGLHAQSHTLVAAADCMRAVKDAQIRAVLAYIKLSSDTCDIENWRQFVHLQFGMRSNGAYMIDPVQLCQVVEAESFLI